MNGRLGLIVVVAIAACACPASAQSWRPYHNDRFGTVGASPAGWIAQRPPDNGDGQIFSSPDGRATLTISAGYNEPATPAGLARLAGYEDAGTVTYRKAGKDWIVVSGQKNGQIFYRRYVLSCANSIWNSVSVDYPAAEKSAYDAIVAHAGAALRGARTCP